MSTKQTPTHAQAPWQVIAKDDHYEISIPGIEWPGAVTVNYINGDAEAKAALIASAPELLAERDRLKALNEELVATLTGTRSLIEIEVEHGSETWAIAMKLIDAVLAKVKP